MPGIRGFVHRQRHASCYMDTALQLWSMNVVIEEL